MLNLRKAKTPHEQESIKRQIDHLVYELYGLTEEEIRIVEAQLPGRREAPKNTK